MLPKTRHDVWQLFHVLDASCGVQIGMIMRTVDVMNTPWNRLGAIVAEAMHKAGVSENTAARTIGISRQTLDRRLERGNFDDAELATLAPVLSTRASSLLKRAGL